MIKMSKLARLLKAHKLFHKKTAINSTNKH